MSEPIGYTSEIRIERIKGPHRRAYLPETPDPIHFGVHSEIAEHYDVDPNLHNTHATTIDHVIAATAG